MIRDIVYSVKVKSYDYVHAVRFEGLLPSVEIFFGS